MAIAVRQMVNPIETAIALTGLLRPLVGGLLECSQRLTRPNPGVLAKAKSYTGGRRHGRMT